MNSKIPAAMLVSVALSANLKIGADVQYSNYKEFDSSNNNAKLMEDRGLMAGVFINFSHDLSKKWQINSYARALWGGLKYDGAYITIDPNNTKETLIYDGDPFTVFDAETTFVYNSSKLKDIRPFIGFGIRRLTNSPYGPGSYYRYENYYYLPVGIKKGDFKLTYRWLIVGDNQSLIPPSSINVKQHTGSGIYIGKKMHFSSKYQTELYAEYWDIADSNFDYIGDHAFLEPKNHNYSAGIKISSDLNL